MTIYQNDMSIFMYIQQSGKIHLLLYLKKETNYVKPGLMKY